MPGATFRAQDKDGNFFGKAVTLESNVMDDLNVLLEIPGIGNVGVFGLKLRLQPAIEQGSTSNAIIKLVNGSWYQFKSSIREVMLAVNALWGAFGFIALDSRVLWSPGLADC